MIRISRRLFNQYHTDLFIVAVDSSTSSLSSYRYALNSVNSVEYPTSTSMNSIVLHPAYRDIRLGPALDINQHFSENYEFTPLRVKDKYVIPDMQSSKVELVQSLNDIWKLFKTLTKDISNITDLLNKFDFLIQWNTLDDTEKLKKYSEYGCHELHIWLYYKDGVFFEKVVRNYLENKLKKTFIDKFLLNHDMNEYLQSHLFQQLNCIEKLLLSERVDESSSRYIAEYVLQEYQLLPPQPELHIRLMKTVLESKSLESDPSASLVPPAEREQTKSFAPPPPPPMPSASFGYMSAPCPPPPMSSGAPPVQPQMLMRMSAPKPSQPMAKRAVMKEKEKIRQEVDEDILMDEEEVEGDGSEVSVNDIDSLCFI